MAVPQTIQLLSCSELIAQVDALSKLDAEDVAQFHRQEAARILSSGTDSDAPSPNYSNGIRLPSIRYITNVATSVQALASAGTAFEDDDLPAWVPASVIEGDEELVEKRGFHASFPCRLRSLKPLGPVLEPALKKYSIIDATNPSKHASKESKLTESFFPRPFTNFGGEGPIEFGKPCGPKCLQKAADEIRSIILANGGDGKPYRSRVFEHAAKKQTLSTPHYNPFSESDPDTTIEFEQINPSPHSRGVPIRDIRVLKEVCVLRANETAFDDSPQESDTIVVIFKAHGCEEYKVKITVGCDCGEMTMAHLAFILADQTSKYHKIHQLGSTIDLYLCSLSLSPDLKYWYPTYAEIQK